jgi:hypothetical protein
MQVPDFSAAFCEELVTSAAAHQEEAFRGLVQEANISKRRDAIPPEQKPDSVVSYSERAAFDEGQEGGCFFMASESLLRSGSPLLGPWTHNALCVDVVSRAGRITIEPAGSAAG